MVPFKKKCFVHFLRTANKKNFLLMLSINLYKMAQFCSFNQRRSSSNKKVTNSEQAYRNTLCAFKILSDFVF